MNKEIRNERGFVEIVVFMAITLLITVMFIGLYLHYNKSENIQAEVVDSNFVKQEPIIIKTFKVRNGLERGTLYRIIDTEAGVIVYMMSNSTGTGVGAVPLSQTTLTIPLN